MPAARSPDVCCAPGRGARRWWVWLVVLAAVGCRVADKQAQRVAFFLGGTLPAIPTDASAQAALDQARELDRRGDAGAVDLYYRAAVQSVSPAQRDWTPGVDPAQLRDVYHQALAGLIDAGQRYGRLDPRRQLIVVDGGTRVVPIRYFGFAWRPDEFCRLLPARYTSRDIAHHYANPGVGLPLIGARIAACPDDEFYRPWQPFAVTAVLRPAAEMSAASGASAGCGPVLELYNPLVFDSLAWYGAPRPLARDQTAPLAAVVDEAPRQYLRGFTAPTDTSVQPKLVMVEPYQRGKIPVVFIHGLYSDPITWADMANELRAERDLYDQYQFWTFRYPTGGELLDSAEALRQKLRIARDTYDGQRDDPAMDQIVLVGHSLGGLVSKMQVTTSYDLLWREVADQPFDALRAPPELQARLARDFFYEPVPMVKRVVFIGTPHHGSGMARRLVGRASSLLVDFGSEQKEAYRELMDQNRDVFKPLVQRRRPTTISILDPGSPVLAGLAQMPVSCAVHLHSIIGTGGDNPLGEPGDGVVSVSSAEHYGESELFVPAKHEKLHRHPASIAEVARILRLHAATLPAASASTVTTSTVPTVTVPAVSVSRPGTGMARE